MTLRKKSLSAIISGMVLFSISQSVCAVDRNEGAATEGALTDRYVPCEPRGAAPGVGVKNRQNIDSLFHLVAVFNEEGLDPRVKVKAKDIYSAVGVLISDSPAEFDANDHVTKRQRNVCTASMISPCHILTANHCVSGGFSRVTAKETKNLKFSVGQKDGGGFKYSDLEPTLVKLGEMKGTFSEEDFPEDWAVLKLKGKECVGKDPAIGWLPFYPAGIFKDTVLSNIQIIGMYQDLFDLKNLQLYVQKKCRIIAQEFAPEQYAHDCAAFHGTSGAPLVYVKNGVPHIVAIEVGDFSDGTTEIVKHLTDDVKNVAISMMNVQMSVPLEILKANGDDAKNPLFIRAKRAGEI